MTKISFTRIFQALRTSALLKCPRCGVGGLFAGFFRMRPDCFHCQLTFEREQGFFVGAIYVNYAATVLIVLPGFFLLDYYTNISLSQQLLLWGAFGVFFPVLFFRHSRSLWLSFAYLLDPEQGSGLRLVI